jgi:hypothetical protein
VRSFSNVREQGSGGFLQLFPKELRNGTDPAGKASLERLFRPVSKVLGPKLVELEVSSLGLGDQLELDWVPLIGLSYDPRSDVLSVMVEGIEHNIQHPQQIHVEQNVETLHSIEVDDGSGTHHILLLKDPLRLPTA